MTATPESPTPDSQEAPAPQSGKTVSPWMFALPLVMAAISIIKLGMTLGWWLHPDDPLRSGIHLETHSVSPLETRKDAITYGDWRVQALAAQGNAILAGAGAGSALISLDGGAHWQVRRVSHIKVAFRDAAILPDGRWLLSSADTLWVSSDQGQTWQARTDLEKMRNSSAELRLTHDGILIANDGQFSLDLGSHWEKLQPDHDGISLYGIASAQSVQRALRGTAQKKLERQMRQSLAQLGPFGSLGLDEDRQSTNDLVYSANLQHWLSINHQTVLVSHDQGKSFAAATLSPALVAPSIDASAPTPAEGTDGVPYASAISDDGSFAVLVVGPQREARMATGTFLDDMENPHDFRVYISRDAGRSFKRMEPALSARDVGSVQIIDAAKGEFLVFHGGLDGVTRIAGARIENFSTGGYGSNVAVRVGQGWILAGNRLIGWQGDKLVNLTKDLPENKCTASFGAHDGTLQTIAAYGDENCLLLSHDGGEHWDIRTPDELGWGALISPKLPGLGNLATQGGGVSWGEHLADLRVDASGQIWAELIDTTQESINQPTAGLAGSTAWLFSSDGGKTWTAGDTPPAVAISGMQLRQRREKMRELEVKTAGQIFAANLTACSADKAMKATCLLTLENAEQLYLKPAGDRSAQAIPHPYAGEISLLARSDSGERLLALAQGGALLSADGGKNFRLQGF